MMLYKEFSLGMQKYARALVFVLLVGLAASSFAFAFSYFISAWDTAANRTGPRQLSVSGEGKVAVRPDIAVFSAGVVTQAGKVGDAQKENTERSNAIIAFLKKHGIEEADIKTIGYSIDPQYQYFDSPPCIAGSCPPRRPPEIIAYEVRHTLKVKVHDLGKTDTLLEGVVAVGANEVGSIGFQVDDKEKPKAEARKQAIEDAEKKGRILARDLGVRLTRITGFFEAGEGGPIPFGAEGAFGKGGFGGGVSALRAPAVEPGEQEIRSTVTITYEFR